MGADLHRGLRVKGDTYVLETHIHYPTDIGLLYDSVRKCLDTMGHILKHLPLEGWRKRKAWARRFRNQARHVSRIAGGGGKNKDFRLVHAVGEYLRQAKALWQKIQASLPRLAACGNPRLMALEEVLKKYQSYLLTFVDQIDRRLLQKEAIPHEEKIFSIFEPHTEWINKGKKHPKVELGHPVLIATDQFHFILTHQVVEKQADVALAQPLVKKIKETYNRHIRSLSLDRGFYSKLNKEALKKEVEHLCLPKKGKCNAKEAQEEAQKSFVKLRHQHSAVEANINQLEHHGLNKCPDKGLHGFKRYTALGVLAYNLHRLGNMLVQQNKKQRPRLRRKAA